MNNEQFRRLIAANAEKSSSDKSNATPSGTSRASAALGSRLKSSIPMTPRVLFGSSKNAFEQQLAEREQADRPQKRFRTSAPRGSKLGEGYVDRAKERHADDEDDRAVRLKALEELFRSQELDRETYEKLRGEIAGGDLSSTHLVKGLDFKLLEKVRRGEDVYGDKGSADAAGGDSDYESGPRSGLADVDDAFDALESAEVHAVTRGKTQKKGQLSTAPAAAGRKRTRDQILAELKAAREAAKAAPTSGLSSKFKKIGVKKTPGTRFERDSKGREVMIIVDEDGHERRKVRKLAAVDESTQQEREAFVPDKNAEVLGMEIPEVYRKKQEELERQAKEAAEAEVNIFDDAEDYDPLAGLRSDSDDDSSSDGASDEEGEDTKKRVPSSRSPERRDPSQDNGGNSEDESPNSRPQPAKRESSPATASRNYFKDSKTGLLSETVNRVSAAADPAVLAALRKAKALNMAAKSEAEQQNAEREERLKKMLRDSNRDAEDLDMGFGTNRQEDEADMEERDVKLSAWGNEDDDGGNAGGGKSKRKRGPKKRKGDVNSAADVLKAMERRKADKA